MNEPLPEPLPDALDYFVPETLPDRTMKAHSSSSPAAPGATKTAKSNGSNNFLFMVMLPFWLFENGIYNIHATYLAISMPLKFIIVNNLLASY